MTSTNMTEAATLAASSTLAAPSTPLPLASPTPSNVPPIAIIPDTNELPTPEQLSNAFKTQVLDADGKAHNFVDLSKTSPTVLIIFIRHFYCSACQMYVEALTKTFPPHLLYPATPLTINIIGCGPPALITPYTTSLKSHLPHYTSPDLSLQHSLGIKDCTLSSSMQKSKYLDNTSSVKMIFKGIGSALKWRTGEWYKVGGGGPVTQAGGEYLFVNGEATWGHKMKTGGDHVDVDVLEEVLGKFGGEGGMHVRKGLRRDRMRGCELRTDEDEHVRRSFDSRRDSSSSGRKRSLSRPRA